LWFLVCNPVKGLFHVAGRGGDSRFEMARLAFDFLEIKTPIEPVDSSRYPRKAAVPADATLDCSEFERVTGRTIRRWEDALRDYLLSEIQKQERPSCVS